MINKISQKGSAHVIIIVILVIGIVGTLGFIFWKNHMNKNSSNAEPTQNQSETSNTSNETEALKSFSLLNGKIKFTNDGTWKTTTGGYYSQVSGKCGQGATSDSTCLDHLMLIPSNETFINPDQFQMNIGIFDSGDLPPKEWLKQHADLGGEDPTTSASKIAGFESYRYEVKYGNDEVRLAYAIKLEGNVVLVTSTFFQGDYYSYKNQKDYRPMIASVDKFVTLISQ